MIQDGPHLFHGHIRKPFDELIDTASIFQVLEKLKNNWSTGHGESDWGKTANDQLCNHASQTPGLSP
jgi:hypothetical protein